MPGCCVKNCRRGSGKDQRDPQGNKVSLFYFPKDPKLREQWLKACQRKEGELKLNCAAVCDRHFLPVCFENRWTEQRSKNQRRIIRRLKDDATQLLIIPEQTVKRLKMTRKQSSCKTGIPSYNELVNYASSTGLDNNADSLPSCAPSTSKTMDIGMDSFKRSKINPSELVEVIQHFDDPPNKMNELVLRLKKVEEEKQQLAAINMKLSIKIQQLEQENCQLKDICDRKNSVLCSAVGIYTRTNQKACRPISHVLIGQQKIYHPLLL